MSGDEALPPVRDDGLRHWTVGGGIVIENDSCLLVHNRRKNGSFDWSTPGGVIDQGESMVEGLGREVTEETGITVQGWDGPLYRVEVVAPGFGFHLRAEAHRSVSHSGQIIIDDPDGIVVAAEFVARTEVAAKLESAPRWVAEPLLGHLLEGVDDGRLYSYRVEGAPGSDRRVLRV